MRWLWNASHRIVSVCFVLCSGVLIACSSAEPLDTGEKAAHAEPMAQSAAARALRLPRMQPSPSRVAMPGDRPVVVRVRILIEGSAPADTTVQSRSFDPACGDTFVDTAVVRNGNAVADAIVWAEGPATPLITDGRSERRPTVQLELCRLRPRVQLAVPGSTLMLVMRDSIAESLVVVPSSLIAPVDTVPFIMDGQLVPLQHLADSSGVLAVYASRLPWARSFVAIAPPGSTALSDADGRVQFTLDGRGAKATIRAWHPSLGLVAAKLDLVPNKSDYELTLTFRR